MFDVFKKNNNDNSEKPPKNDETVYFTRSAANSRTTARQSNCLAAFPGRDYEVALAHQKFVFNHPFIDGNGRVARLILNLALIRGEYTIALIPAILRHEYVQSLEMSHKTPQAFVDFIAERIIATQMDLLRLLNDGGVNDGINGGVLSDTGRVEFRGAPKNGGYHIIYEQHRRLLLFAV